MVFLLFFSLFLPLLYCITLSVGCSLETDEDRVTRLFAAWRRTHERVYTTVEEEAQRRNNFVSTIRRADAYARTHRVHNADHDEFGRLSTFSGWADLSATEMLHRTGGIGTISDFDLDDIAPLDFSTRAPMLFRLWKSEHNVTYYSASEEALRYANFQCTVR